MSITTLNAYGVMMVNQKKDFFVNAWINKCSRMSKNESALEIGAAFGSASLQAFSQGATNIIVNDMHKPHLNKIYNEWNAKYKNSDNELNLFEGRVPNCLENWRPNKPVTNILAANVFHFLSPEEIIKTGRELYEVSESNAELFVSVDSPWTSTYKPFWLIYYFRKYILRDANPGYIYFPNFMRFILPERLSGISIYHAMEPETLQKMLEKAGWKLKKGCYFSGDHEGNPSGVNLGGEEMSGVHMVK